MVVRGFLEHGCSRVYITARKAAQCDAAATELSQYGECISLPGDISSQEGINTLAAAIAEREPVTLADLDGIAGIGSKKRDAYGAEVLRVCA